MLERAEIIVQLKRDIINGKMNLQQTKDKISELEAQYGQDFFFDFEYDEAKPKPWGEEYLHELEIQSMAGMSSKQFIMHLAEVSEDIYSRKSGKSAAKSKEKSTPNRKKVLLIVFIVAVIILIGIAIATGAFRERNPHLNRALWKGVNLWESLLSLKMKLITLFPKHWN